MISSLLNFGPIFFAMDLSPVVSRENNWLSDFSLITPLEIISARFLGNGMTGEKTLE